jgi:hypothetical protein
MLCTGLKVALQFDFLVLEVGVRAETGAPVQRPPAQISTYTAQAHTPTSK